MSGKSITIFLYNARRLSTRDVGDFDKVPARLFIEDGVHFTPEGYNRYEIFLRNVLKNELE